jgi:hypothetical protein
MPDQKPLTDARLSNRWLSAMEAEHQRSGDEGWDCTHCGDVYPCPVAQLITEVRRLRDLQSLDATLNEAGVLPAAIVKEANGQKAYYRRMWPGEKIIKILN